MQKLLTSASKAYVRLQQWRQLYFPERQIFLRSEGRVRFLTIHSYTQVAMAAALLGAVGWGALTSYAYLSRDFLIEDKNNTITTMSVQYQALSNDFSALELEVERRAQLLEERQRFLEEFAIPSVQDSTDTPIPAVNVSEESDSDPAPTADTVPTTDTADKLSFIDSLFGITADEPAQVSETTRRTNLLKRLQHMEERQRLLATALSDRMNGELDHIEQTIADTKLTASLLIEKSTPSTSAAGGPFIPDQTFDDIFTVGDSTPFLNLKENSDRLKIVTNALNSYPVGKPATDYYLSSRFGRRRDPFKKTWARHPGLDLAGWPGTAILATAPGKVVHAGWYGPYGNMVEVDHGNGFRTRYGHMRKVRVKKNENVILGQQVGEMGKTGRATDTHVHYEVWFNGDVTDPLPYMKAADNVLEIQGRYEKTSEQSD